MSIMNNWSMSGLQTSMVSWALILQAGLAVSALQLDDASQPAAPKAPNCEIGSPVVVPVALDGKDHPAEKAIETAEDLLAALEQSDKELVDLQAGIRYDVLKGIAGDQQIRTGQVALKNTQPRSFAVRFVELQVGARIDQVAQTYVFDGRWLVEKDDANKLFIKREIVREGEQTDPLKIGQGPFPLPIGQAASEILALYDAKLVEATTDLVANTPADQAAIENFVNESKQLVLTPKAGDTGDLTKIQLWYRKVNDRWLPRMARTTNKQDDIALIQLINIQVNQGLAGDALSISAPTESGWSVREEKLSVAPAENANTAPAQAK
jgi:hypothetical protein